MHDVTRRIKDFNKNRIPNMVQLKYQFMAENMFRFYRGTCHLFYEDLYKEEIDVTSPLVWICGDLHLENFGSYKGDNRLVYFDLNDFDEACLAPAVFELTRIVTSIFIAFASLQIPLQEASAMAELFLAVYSNTLKKGKALYIEPQIANGIVRTFLCSVSERKEKELLQRFTVVKKEQRVFVTDEVRFFKIEKLFKKELYKHIETWLTKNLKEYTAVDIVFRVAGTGSVGVRRYVFLLQNKQQPGKYILLEMKEAAESSLKPYVKTKQPKWANNAERIMEVEKRMQNVSAALLDTTIFDKRPFILQEMQPVKDGIDFTLIKKRYKDIRQVINDMAMLTASAQLRSSGRQGAAIADQLIAFGADTGWQKSILQYCTQYKKQVEKDYHNFCSDYKKGIGLSK